MTFSKEKILEIADKKGFIKSREITSTFDISRQYVNKLVSQLVDEKKLIKIGQTRYAQYVTPGYLETHPELSATRYSKKFKNESIEEHKILDDVEHSFVPYKNLPENIKSIFDYAFLEMINNAIDHSQTKTIHVSVSLEKNILEFTIDDFGIGVYRNIMGKRGLSSEIEAIQDLLKGKMTTAPKLHSGEGIFFTSKVGDEFVLDSFGYQFIANNTIPDIFVKKVRGLKKGTKVTFRIGLKDTHHLNDIFKKYTNLTGGDHGFDKTEIRVRLYALGGVHISRSQARRVTDGLNKFKIVVMDYDKVPMIGQAFADEVYRIFQSKYPNITIQNENMNEAVQFMVERAQQEAKVGRE
jgi:anti-sigma regulatory factor (Ser/Thr protein kinase)